MLAFRADAGYVFGVDIGEVKVRTAVADLRGSVVAERVREFAGEERLPVIRRAIGATLTDAGVARAELLSSCVGCTGAMDTPRGRVLFSSIFEDDYDLAGSMARSLGRPVVIENDCNLAVIAERWCGAGARSRRPRVHPCRRAHRRGHHGRRVADARPCGRGGRARRSSARSSRSTARVGSRQLVRELSGEAPEAVFTAAGAGDEEALEIVERAERWAGHGIVTTAQIVNPELVVIGGGVARAGEVLLAPLRARLERMVRRPPRLAASPLAERGPLLGALRLALDELEPRLLAGLEEAA